eukprot:scaffold5932_cov36-Phaeocystis_antarctica.AAC.1
MGAGVPRVDAQGYFPFCFKAKGLPAGRKPPRSQFPKTRSSQPPFACGPALRLPPSSSTADTARPNCAADGSAWGSALYGRRIVSGAAGVVVATGEWRPGVWWHIGRREGGTLGGVARWHQMDDECSEEGPRRVRSGSIQS